MLETHENIESLSKGIEDMNSNFGLKNKIIK